jgi:hypothetical protein
LMIQCSNFVAVENEQYLCAMWGEKSTRNSGSISHDI